MKNLQKRILTSLIILPLSIFFILKGGYFLLFFLLAIFFLANYELFSFFNKKATILLLDLILILSLYFIYYVFGVCLMPFHSYKRGGEQIYPICFKNISTFHFTVNYFLRQEIICFGRRLFPFAGNYFLWHEIISFGMKLFPLAENYSFGRKLF